MAFPILLISSWFQIKFW